MSVPAIKYCYLYYNLIVAATLPRIPSIHDGKGVIHVDPYTYTSYQRALSTSALRRAFELWTDSGVIESSCGDALAPAVNLAVNEITTFANQNYITPT